MENDNLIAPKPSALDFLLRNCWELFYHYLTNLEIGKLDSALTNFSLRIIFLSKVMDFYLVNKIYAKGEIEWILARHITLTKCHLEFEIKGNNKPLYKRIPYHLSYLYNFLR